MLQATLRKRLPSAYADLADSTYAVPDLTTIPSADATAILEAYMAASHAVFVLLIPLIGVCFLGCVLIHDRDLQYQAPTPDPELPPLPPAGKKRFQPLQRGAVLESTSLEVESKQDALLEKKPGVKARREPCQSCEYEE